MYMLIKYEVNAFSKTQNFTWCLKVGKQLIILKGCMHEKKKRFYCSKMTKILYFYHIWSLEMNLKKTKVKISTICGLEYLLHK